MHSKQGHYIVTNLELHHIIGSSCLCLASMASNELAGADGALKWADFGFVMRHTPKIVS